jgi:hypothetical protein
VAEIAEESFGDLKSPPQRIGLPDCPTPTTPALANHYYPRAIDIVIAVRKMLGLDVNKTILNVSPYVPLDVPDLSFTGPF